MDAIKAEFRCPKCGGKHWGTLDLDAGTVECHADGCGWNGHRNECGLQIPPREFSNAMNKIGRPVGESYRSSPEWKIWLAARKYENGRMKDELEAADELIEMLEREIEG